MTFKITVTRIPVAIEFESESLGGAADILEKEDTELRRIVTIADGMVAEHENNHTTITTEASAPRRGRGPNKPKSVAEAIAPAPLLPPNTAENANGIPAFLDRTAPVAPPPPPPPAPPSGILAGKIIANLDARAVDDMNKGMLVTWLASPPISLVTAGVPYADAIDVLRLTGDDKLSYIASQLQIA